MNRQGMPRTNRTRAPRWVWGLVVVGCAGLCGVIVSHLPASKVAPDSDSGQAESRLSRPDTDAVHVTDAQAAQVRLEANPQQVEEILSEPDKKQDIDPHGRNPHGIVFWEYNLPEHKNLSLSFGDGWVREVVVFDAHSHAVRHDSDRAWSRSLEHSRAKPTARPED